MKEEELKSLIEKYYSGISTDEEELALKAYFTENSAFPGYETEKEIFSFYNESGGMPEPSADFEARIIKAIDDASGTGRSSKFRKLLVPILSAAAGLLILAGSYFFFINRAEPKDTYANPDIAYAETMKILMNVSSKMNHGTSSLRPVGKINEMKIKSLGSINKSSILIEKNLRSLGYLRNADIKSASKK